jgi:hypothetical protein
LELTPAQLQAVVRGEPVPIIIDQTECILVRRDVFEGQDSVRDTYATAMKAWDMDGSPADGELYR